MRKRHVLLITLVFALVISASIQPAIAYFTTYTSAKGGIRITAGNTTRIAEEFSNWEKRVTITNQAGSEPVFIRARVVYTGLDGSDGVSVSGEGWTAKQADGYYYYGKGSAAADLTVLEANQATTQLSVNLKNIVPGKPEKGDTFGLTVLYESTPVRYTEAGALKANWDKTLIQVGSTTGGNG